MNKAPDLPSMTADADDFACVTMIAQMKEVLSELHQKHMEDMGRQQAEHEMRVLALVKGISAGNSVPKQARTETDTSQASVPGEYLSTESQQMAAPCQRSSKPSYTSPGPSTQKPNAEASPGEQNPTRKAWDSAVPKVTHTDTNLVTASEAKLQEIRKNAKKLMAAWSKFNVDTRSAGRLQNFNSILEHPAAEVLTCTIIFCNTIFVAAQADHTARTLSEPNDFFWQGLNVFFLVFFTAEILLRLIAEQKDFFHGKRRIWNGFDSFIVSLSLVELVSDAFSSASVVRVVRTLRILRVARFVKVLRFTHELHTMVMCILKSIGTLIWALLLLLLNMFMFAVFITARVAYERREIHDGKTVDIEFAKALDENYGSLLATIYSLFKAVTGGDDWSVFADLLFEINVVVGMVFCFYVAFTLIAVLNVVGGLFINNAFDLIEEDKSHIIMEQTESRQKTIADLKKAFRMADRDKSGKVSRDEFLDHIKTPVVQAYFGQIGLDVEEDLEGLFDLLDFEEDGTLDIEEFVAGCLHVRGDASSLDVERCHHCLRQVRKDVSELRDHVLQGQSKLNQNVMDLFGTQDPR